MDTRLHMNAPSFLQQYLLVHSLLKEIRHYFVANSSDMKATIPAWEIIVESPWDQTEVDKQSCWVTELTFTTEGQWGHRSLRDTNTCF